MWLLCNVKSIPIRHAWADLQGFSYKQQLFGGATYPNESPACQIDAPQIGQTFRKVMDNFSERVACD